MPRLTDARVAAIKPPATGQAEHGDELVTGLRLRVGAGGRKAWILRTRAGGKMIYKTLGAYPSLGLADARDAARGLLIQIAKEGAPRDKKTFGDAARHWIDNVAKARNSSWKNQERQLEIHVLPHWRDKAIDSIKRGDVRDLIDGIDGKIAPSRVLAIIKVVMRYALYRDWIEASPADAIPPPGADIPRDRFLPMADIARVYRAADLLGYPNAGFVKLLILTGQRRTEVASMRWSDVDLEAKTWLIPSENSKNDRAQLVPLIDRVARGLQVNDVRPKEAIAICASASVEYVAIFLGALRAGIAVSPLAPSSTPQQLIMMLDDCAAPILFLDSAAGELVAVTAGDVRARRIALDDSKAGEAFGEWLPQEGVKPQPVAIAPDWPFNIIYSSGTTGTPKGIVHSHAFRWVVIPSASELFRFGSTTVTMVATPLYSNTTLGCVLATLSYGGALVLMQKFDATGFLALAQRHRATHAMLVPVQYRRLMATADFDTFDLSSFEMKFCTSAPFPAELKADVLRRWPGGLVEFYGMTEGGGSFVLVAHEHPDKLHTVGRPVPGCDIRIIDEQGAEVSRGHVGEVVGRSSAMMSGYHNQPGKTAAAEWIGPDGQRFIRTGDVGRFDEDGFLILMDRKKDMIISGGFNIYPSDIEAVIVQHPAVLEAAVVGLPSDAWGETPVAFVTPKAGAAIDVPELAAFVNARVGKTQRPQAYQLVDQLPRSAIGKVLKRELRDRFGGRVA